ncbi:MAG: vWA domain-containing protein, partial [Chloroflexia bacterium]
SPPASGGATGGATGGAAPEPAGGSEAPASGPAATSPDPPPTDPAATSPEPPAQLSTQPTPEPSTNQSLLKAGQVDDNASFNDYLAYLQSYNGARAIPIDVTRRLFLRVLDSNQHPVAGARVQLFDAYGQVFDGATVSDGRVLIFPNIVATPEPIQGQSFRAVISRGQARYETNVVNSHPQDLTVKTDLVLDAATSKQLDNTGPVGIDLVFLVDATGSMGDELDKIKSTVDTIASRIEQLPGSSKPRLGLVAYRDRGDDYVTRLWDFTDNVGQFSSNLSQVTAEGGGDEPESVSAGLHDAIHLPGWADNSHGRHLRMVVLVGDAPPHLDYGIDSDYIDLLRAAVAAGIKIFPIGASGLNDQGEYIFRQFAQITQGQFVFLTYANGESGAPGASTTDHVSNYTVKDLDALVVSLVAGEVANQTGVAVQDTGSVTGDVVQDVSSVTVAGTTVPPSTPKTSTSAMVGLALLGLVAFAFGQAWAVADWFRDLWLGPWSLFSLLIIILLLAWSRSQVQRARVLRAQTEDLALPATGRMQARWVPVRKARSEHPEAAGSSSPYTRAASTAEAIEQTQGMNSSWGQQTVALGTLPPEIARALRHDR